VGSLMARVSGVSMAVLGGLSTAPGDAGDAGATSAGASASASASASVVPGAGAIVAAPSYLFMSFPLSFSSFTFFLSRSSSTWSSLPSHKHSQSVDCGFEIQCRFLIHSVLVFEHSVLVLPG